MMAWVTGSPNWVNNRTTSVEYRFLSSMQGSLGVGANLDKWTPDDFALAKDMIATYKQVRETVHHGSLYRLISPQHNSEYSATESVSLDKQHAVLFIFLHSSQEGTPSLAFISVVSISTGNTTCASSIAPRRWMLRSGQRYLGMNHGIDSFYGRLPSRRCCPGLYGPSLGVPVIVT